MNGPAKKVVSPGKSELPVTRPRSLMPIPPLKSAPPRLPRSVGLPFCQSTACREKVGPEKQLPDPPTASPLSLIAFTYPSGSPATVGSGFGTPLSQMTASFSFSGLEQVESSVAFSASPPTWPRLLIAEAEPLLPPSVGSAVMTPFCHTNGRQVRRVPKKQKSSPNGSGVEVSASPGTTSASLGPKNAMLFGPPSVPRSVIRPFCHMKACCAVLSFRAALPTTLPPALMPRPTLNVPPSVPRSVTKYRGSFSLWCCCAVTLTGIASRTNRMGTKEHANVLDFIFVSSGQER